MDKRTFILRACRVSMISLLHLFSVLAKLSSTSSSSFAWVRSKIFRVLHQKYSCSLYKCRQGSIIISRYQFKKSGRGFTNFICPQSKKLGKASSLFLDLNPKRWVRLHQKFFYSNQKDWQASIFFSFSIQKKGARFLVLNPKSRSRLRHFYLFSIEKRW